MDNYEIKGDQNACYVNLTYKCNSNCISCIMENHYQDYSELTFDYIKKRIDMISKRSNHIEFNGGEPTLRPDLLKILDYTNKKREGIEIGLISNVRLFAKKENVEKLKNLKLNNNFKIITSIYGHNSKLHDAITLSPNSFKEQIIAIKYLVSKGIKIELRIIINRMNYRYLAKMAKFLCSKFNKNDFLSVDFINTKLIGNAKKYIKIVAVQINEITPPLKQAVNILNKNRFNVRLFHFPNCTLPKDIEGFSIGKSAEETMIEFTDFCNNCSKLKVCSGIWKGYMDVFGNEEFKPIIKLKKELIQDESNIKLKEGILNLTN